MAQLGLALQIWNRCHCSSVVGWYHLVLVSVFFVSMPLCTIVLKLNTTSDTVALMKTHFQRIDLFFHVFLFASATLSAISLDIKWNKPSTCCSFNSCVGNREMEMNAARFTARGLEKKWLLYCLWLKDCFKYIFLSFCKFPIFIRKK